MAIELEDGTIVRSLPEQVDYLTTHNEENEIAIDNLAARLEAAIAGVLHYKGSVATYADLPADAEVGDVYNVIDTGANYAWTGEEWDELGSSIDTSNLMDLISNQTSSGIKTFSNGIKTNSVEQTGSVLRLGRGGYDVEFRDSIYPDSQLYDIGKSSNKWRDIWLDRAINLGASGIIKYENSTFTFNDDILPAVTGSYDLGSSTYKWKATHTEELDIYFGSYQYQIKDGTFGQLYIGRPDGTNGILVDAGIIRSRGGVPRTNNLYDLGSSSYKWRDIYLSGNLSDGTNSVTIADLKALIDYAKAQGWIS